MQIIIEDLGQNVNLELINIPAGTYIMGSPDSEPDRHIDEGPQHEVRVSGFAMGINLITQAQWQAVTDQYPSHFQGIHRPVECVSWYDAVDFCEKLSQKSGRNYRLPTESEWEYACRAGTTSPFYFGRALITKVANFRSESTTDVGSFSANGFGLQDMHGNLWEWCQDHWHDNYQGAPTDGTAWITNGNPDWRVIRGGSWAYNPRYCRSACRNFSNPDNRNNSIGFRVVCETQEM